MHLIRGKVVHFPGKNGKKGGRINIFEGKVHLIRGNLVHSPPEKKRNGDKINIFGGKVHQKSGKMVHFPPKLSAGPKTCPAPETDTGREGWRT